MGNICSSYLLIVFYYLLFLKVVSVTNTLTVTVFFITIVKCSRLDNLIKKVSIKLLP